jgi:hypothetical protein
MLHEPVPKPCWFFHWLWSFASLKSLLYKDLRLAKHPKSKEAVPKTEVLEQPHLTTESKSRRRIVKVIFSLP